MNKWIVMAGIALMGQSAAVAECSTASRQEAQAMYQKALQSQGTVKQLTLLEASLEKCYSPEIDIQISLLRGDVAYGNKQYKKAKNHYNNMLTLIGQVKDPDTQKQLHLLSYTCLRDTYQAMGEKELASIMQHKYDERKSQTQSISADTIASAQKIVRSLRLGSGNFKGVSVTQSVNLHVNFQFDSDAFSEEGEAQARELAIALKELQADYPGAKVEIIGYTDTKGKAAYNQKLSERRARALVRFLTSGYHFDKIAFSSQGKGEQEPKCREGYVIKKQGEYTCTGSEDTRQSRRVEIRFGY